MWNDILTGDGIRFEGYGGGGAARSEESYRQLFEQSVDGIIITAEGKIVEANSAFCTLYGAPMKTVIGLESLTLIHPEDRDAAVPRVQSLLSG